MLQKLLFRSGGSSFVIIMTPSETTQKLFELHQKLVQAKHDLIINITRYAPARVSSQITEPLKMFNIQLYRLVDNKVTGPFMNCLQNCIGKRVGAVELTIENQPKWWYLMFHLFEQVRFNIVRIWTSTITEDFTWVLLHNQYSQNYFQFFSAFTSWSYWKNIVLMICIFTMNKIHLLIQVSVYFLQVVNSWNNFWYIIQANFLLDMSTIVRSLQIDQQNSYNELSNLFGNVITKRPSMILDMFSRRIDKLSISTYSQRETLPAGWVDALCEVAVLRASLEIVKNRMGNNSVVSFGMVSTFLIAKERRKKIYIYLITIYLFEIASSSAYHIWISRSGSQQKAV